MLGGRGVRVLVTQPCVCCLVPSQKQTNAVFQFDFYLSVDSHSLLEFTCMRTFAFLVRSLKFTSWGGARSLSVLARGQAEAIDIVKTKESNPRGERDR